MGKPGTPEGLQQPLRSADDPAPNASKILRVASERLRV